jgi:hypothetical protein
MMTNGEERLAKVSTLCLFATRQLPFAGESENV